MKHTTALLSLVAMMQSTALFAGSITLTSGNVQTSGNQVITGNGARAEATVDQRGSVVRLGSNTAAQVGDRGDVSISKGVVLISSGDGVFRRPAVEVNTPQGEVIVRGSAIVAALPDGSVKMTCLEGSVRGDLGGQNMALNPGSLIVQRPEGTRDAVQVNLNNLTASSALLDNASFKQPLPAAPEIRQEVVQQAQVLGTTLTLDRNDSTATQSENKTVEIKSSGPGLLTRIFGIGGSDSKTDDNATATGPVLQIQGGNPSQTQASGAVVVSQGGTSMLRVSGAVSGSNVLLNSTVAPAGTSTGATLVIAGENQAQPVLAASGNISAANQLVVANGATQQLVTQGTLTLANNANVISGASLVRAGSGTLTLNSGVVSAQGGGPTGATLNNGTLVLQGPAAQQYLNGNLTVSGAGGTLAPTSNSGGVITFQAAGGGGTPPAAAP